MLINKIKMAGMLIAGFLAALPLSTAFATEIGDWPSKPIRLVVAYPAGGPTDIVARIFSQNLAEELGQQIVVENISGAGGNIGADAVARATADGYTFLYNTSSIAIAPSTYASVTYDPFKDFTPVSLTAAAPLVLLVNTDVPANTTEELIDLVRSKPDELNYASSGIGAIEHLAGALFLSENKISATHVPYRGSGPALLDLAAGRTDFMLTSLSVALPYVREGRLRALAVTTAERVEALPDVPTMSQTVLPGFEMSAWQGVVAPAGTSSAVISRLNKALNDTLQKAEVQEKLKSNGVISLGGTDEEFFSHLRSEFDRWARIVEITGARSE